MFICKEQLEKFEAALKSVENLFSCFDDQEIENAKESMKVLRSKMEACYFVSDLQSNLKEPATKEDIYKIIKHLPYFLEVIEEMQDQE